MSWSGEQAAILIPQHLPVCSAPSIGGQAVPVCHWDGCVVTGGHIPTVCFLPPRAQALSSISSPHDGFLQVRK